MDPVKPLSLPLFDPPTFENLLQGRRAYGKLSIIPSRRLKRGWQVKILPLTGKRQLFIPLFLTQAPEDIKHCLIDWALLPCRPVRTRKKAARMLRSLLEKKIWNYIESLPNAPHRITRFDPGHFSHNTNSTGNVYNLQEVFNAVNRTCFNGSLTALVRWGRAGSKTSYHTTSADVNGHRFNLITIAGAYNHPGVPRFAIEGIMHHEMMHIAVPPYKRNGRTVIHGKEFKNEEKKFNGHREWRTWEREKLPALARQSGKKHRALINS